MGRPPVIRLPVIPWPHLVGGLILVIMLVPIRRYSLPANLPFELELYRLVVAALVVGWLGSLLVDHRVRLRRTGFEGPLLVIVGSAIASVVVNPERVAENSAEVNKTLMFLLSFVVVLYLTVSGLRRLTDVDFVARCLVLGGVVVAFFAIIEARTGFNLFSHLAVVLPFLRETADVGGYQRLGTARLRVFGSAQHPIALSAALVMLAPLAVYLARRTGHARWWLCALVLGAACASAVSRTGVLMFAVIALVFLWLRPRETLRLWPALLAALVLTHVALPGTLGALKTSFFPPGGLVAEQHKSADSSGSGRLADLGPALERWTHQPLLGEGLGTIIVEPERRRDRREHLRRPVAGHAARDGDRRARGLDLVLRTRDPSLRSRGETRPLGARLAPDGDHGRRGGLRRRDAHLRRVLVHPGHVSDVPLRGTRLRDPAHGVRRGFTRGGIRLDPASARHEPRLTPRTASPDVLHTPNWGYRSFTAQSIHVRPIVESKRSRPEAMRPPGAQARCPNPPKQPAPFGSAAPLALPEPPHAFARGHGCSSRCSPSACS